jgi:hypothetical protein
MADDDNTAPDLWEELKRRSTALTKRDRRKYEAGEHERLWDALYSIYVLRLPMSDWLYEAVMEWMHRTETPRQRQKRNQRTTDAGRALTVLSKWSKGKKKWEAAGSGHYRRD